jgi:hypothetical protein
MTRDPKMDLDSDHVEDDALDPASLAAIRSVLAAEAGAQQPQSLQTPPEAEAEGRASETAETPPPTETARPAAPPRRSADVFPQLQAQAPTPSYGDKAYRKASKARSPRAKQGRLSDLWQRLMDYRPTPRHIVLASLALLVLFRPGLVLGLLALAGLGLAALYVSLGHDGFWLRVLALWGWYARRQPARAAALRTRLERFALRWDALLDRFPGGTVDFLYLPDFEELAQRDHRHTETVERRLSDLNNSGV